MAQTYRVDGLRELLAATERLSKEVNKDVRKQVREAAEPVRDEAQRLFLQRVLANPRKSRYGISVRKTGTVSVEQRVKSRYSRSNQRLKRPQFTEWQRTDALNPAFERKQNEVVRRFDETLNEIERKWLR